MQNSLVKLIRRATYIAIGAPGEGNTLEDPALSEKDTSFVIFRALRRRVPPEEREKSASVLHF